MVLCMVGPEHTVAPYCASIRFMGIISLLGRNYTIRIMSVQFVGLQEPF